MKRLESKHSLTINAPANKPACIMRKIIFLFFVFWATGLSAQNSISRNANFSLFAGHIAKQQNLNNYGDYVGAYVDHPIFTGPVKNLGVWGAYSVSTFNENLTLYKALTKDLVGGLNGGLYLSGNGITSFYGGLAVGYKYSQEIGKVNKTNYFSESKQSDQMIVGNLNLNRFRNLSNWFPRTQVLIIGQMSINSKKTLSEYGRADSTVANWNKGFQEIYLKQSLVDIPLNLSGELLLEPKFGLAYHHYDAGLPNAISFIGELSLKKLFSDDFLSLTFQYKMYPGKNTDYLNIGLAVNIWRLFENKNKNNN